MIIFSINVSVLCLAAFVMEEPMDLKSFGGQKEPPRVQKPKGILEKPQKSRKDSAEKEGTPTTQIGDHSFLAFRERLSGKMIR